MFRNLADNPWLLLVLVVIIVVVFGANKLPGAARSLGRSMRIFKTEVKEMRDDEPRRRDDETAAEPPLHGRVIDDSNDSHGSTRRSRESRTDR